MACMMFLIAQLARISVRITMIIAMLDWPKLENYWMEQVVRSCEGKRVVILRQEVGEEFHNHPISRYLVTLVADRDVRCMHISTSAAHGHCSIVPLMHSPL